MDVFLLWHGRHARNLDGSVERGYAGRSLWWGDGAAEPASRIEDYARANASVGINGTVINNVNANPLVLTRPYLEKAAALYQRAIEVAPGVAVEFFPAGHLLGEIQADNLRIIFGVETIPRLFVTASQFVIVSNMAVVHYRQVGQPMRPERLGMTEIDPAFSRHAGVPDAVGSDKGRDAVRRLQVLRRAHLFYYF